MDYTSSLMRFGPVMTAESSIRDIQYSLPVGSLCDRLGCSIRASSPLISKGKPDMLPQARGAAEQRLLAYSRPAASSSRCSALSKVPTQRAGLEYGDAIDHVESRRTLAAGLCGPAPRNPDPRQPLGAMAGTGSRRCGAACGSARARRASRCCRLRMSPSRSCQRCPQRQMPVRCASYPCEKTFFMLPYSHSLALSSGILPARALRSRGEQYSHRASNLLATVLPNANLVRVR